MLTGLTLVGAGCSNDTGKDVTAPAEPNADAVSAAVQTLGVYKSPHGAQIVSATGDITNAVDAYRTLLGALNPNVAGDQPGGRR